MSETADTNATGEAVPPPVEILYFPPDPDLVEMISSFYHAHIRVAQFDEIERADRPQLRIMLGGAGTYNFADGHSAPAHRATIIGPTSGPVRSVATGPFELFGFGLLPAGWATLIGPETARLTDRTVDAEDLFGDWMTEVVDALTAAPTSADKLVIGMNLVREILHKNRPAPLWFTRTVDNWLMQSSSPELGDLVRETGMSIRSVERMTKQFYGLPPHMLARKFRAMRAAAALVRGEQLDQAGLVDTFYDQSHLIREIKRFAGATPGQLSSATAYRVATTKGRKSLAGRVSPLVSDT